MNFYSCPQKIPRFVGIPGPTLPRGEGFCGVCGLAFGTDRNFALQSDLSRTCFGACPEFTSGKPEI